jgi:hypothetical protein
MIIGQAGNDRTHPLCCAYLYIHMYCELYKNRFVNQISSKSNGLLNSMYNVSLLIEYRTCSFNLLKYVNFKKIFVFWVKQKTYKSYKIQ